MAGSPRLVDLPQMTKAELLLPGLVLLPDSLLLTMGPQACETALLRRQLLHAPAFRLSLKWRMKMDLNDFLVRP